MEAAPRAHLPLGSVARARYGKLQACRFPHRSARIPGEVRRQNPRPWKQTSENAAPSFQLLESTEPQCHSLSSLNFPVLTIFLMIGLFELRYS